MNEERNQNETLAEQTIKRYRRSNGDERALKRRRFTGGMFIVNIVLIVVLYFFFATKTGVDEYLSSSFNYRDLQFRFSMTRDRETRDYIFSLSTRPVEGKSAAARFNANMADLVISYGPTVIVKKTLGENITALNLKPGDTDVRKAVIDHYDLKLFTESHPESVVSTRKSLFHLEKPHLPLNAEVRIHADQPVSTSLKFKYEADQ